jgi:hypothetical protein
MITRYALIGVTKTGKEVVIHPGYKTVDIAKDRAKQYANATQPYPKYIIRAVKLDSIPEWEK